MGTTSIEWTNRSINPIRYGRGHYCQKISPGCANCYASKFQPRVGNEQFGGVSSKHPHFRCTCGADRTGPSAEAHAVNCFANKPQTQYGHQALWLDECKLQEVLRRRTPTKWFWCDMTDMFGDWVPDEWIDKCFAVMALTPQHTHQVLTKRPERMRRYVADRAHLGPRWLVQSKMIDISGDTAKGYLSDDSPQSKDIAWPLPNIWLGVSVEDQQRADERIPLLLQTPAAVRFLSCEPLLGPVDLTRGLVCPKCNGSEVIDEQHDFCTEKVTCPCMGEKPIHWIIVGGESGPNARPMDIAWARSIVEQCKAAGVACFVKQLGADARDGTSDPENQYVRLKLIDRKGGEPEEWPEDLRVREFPEVIGAN